MHLEEIASEDRAAVIAQYVRAGRRRSGAENGAKQARYYFGLQPNPTTEAIRAIADNYPVFRIDYLR